MSKVNVLYVDDEISNLNAFKATFRREFEVYIAIHTEDALAILKHNKIEIIISDQKMPLMTGVQFFESILDKYPDAIRILLTGYSDIGAVINAINKGRVYSYVTKPWNDFDLRQMINNAHSLYLVKQENKILNTRYQRVFQNSSDLILLFNQEGKIIDFNTAAQSLLNLTVNSKLKEVIEEEIDQEYLISQLIENKKLNDYECNFIDRNNTIVNGIISANLLNHLQGESELYQIIFKDITERKITDKQLLKKIIETQEAERRRVADDLHDSLGQELSSVKMMLGVLKDSVLKPEKKAEITAQCHHVLENSISDLRKVCFDLMPSALERGGFIPAFKQLIKAVPIAVDFEFESEYLPIDMQQEIALYRVSQEFVNNTIKHSKATKLKISVKTLGNKQVNVIFEDNGIGFDRSEASIKKGRGQNTMLKRIDSYGGKSSLESIQGKGTKLKITFEC